MADACNLLYMPCVQIGDHYFPAPFSPTTNQQGGLCHLARWQSPQVMQHTSDSGASLQVVCASDGASQQATAQRGEGHNGNAQLAAGGNHFFLECKPRILACRRSLSLAFWGFRLPDI